MVNLVLHPTDLSQWHALVGEAEVRCACHIPEELESYLVFLLMRFSQQAQLSASVMGLDFLHSLQESGPQRHDLLRDVGDKSLLFCGLFPGIAQRRRVRINYFIEMGQAAYCYLSELEAPSVSGLYLLLSEGFIALMQILRAMRTSKDVAVVPSPLLNLSEKILVRKLQ